MADSDLSALRHQLQQGLVIPAVPLALDAQRRFDERHQRALIRYYIDAGAGGIAVGVHTTQFAIRNPNVGLLRPVLTLAAEAADAWSERHAIGRPVKIAGICGPTIQALAEASQARALGYDAGLVSLAALSETPVEALVEHCRLIAEVLPVVGFYLQPAVGGRILPYAFWRRLAEIDRVVAIKIAPFNRYQTLDVIRAVAESGRADQIALYTGNDDTILSDLLTPFPMECPSGPQILRIVWGLLGHWAVWTLRASELLNEIGALQATEQPIPQTLLTRAAATTDCNAALFDAAHGFAGCIAGIHEVLRRQGLLQGTWCIDPNETLSPGQDAEIDRVYRAYPHLNDDAFVTQNLDRWLA